MPSGVVTDMRFCHGSKHTTCAKQYYFAVRTPRRHFQNYGTKFFKATSPWENVPHTQLSRQLTTQVQRQLTTSSGPRIPNWTVFTRLSGAVDSTVVILATLGRVYVLSVSLVATTDLCLNFYTRGCLNLSLPFFSPVNPTSKP